MSPQSSRLAEFGGLGMSFNTCRGTLSSLAMFTAIRNASSRDSRFIDICRCGSSSIEVEAVVGTLLPAHISLKILPQRRFFVRPHSQVR